MNFFNNSEKIIPEQEKIDQAIDGGQIEQEEIEALFEFHLLREIRRINEGNNGIIAELNLLELPPSFLALLQEMNPHMNIEGREKLATKILKIYSPGAGKREALMHQYAYDLIKQQENPDDYVRVPELLLHKEINIHNPEVSTALAANNVNTSFNKVEILIMDLIKGDDLITYLYKVVIKHHPGLVHLKQELEEGNEELKWDDIKDDVAAAFDFNVPGGKSSDLGARNFEMIKVFNENRRRIVDYLAKLPSNPFIPPIIWQRYKNTLNLFEKNGFKQNDQHERNIMVDCDEQGTITDIHEIDFGSAYQKDLLLDGKLGPLFVGLDEDHLPENEVYDRYITLTRSREDTKNLKAERQKNSWVRTYETMKKNIRYQVILQELDGEIQNKSLNAEKLSSILKKLDNGTSGFCEAALPILWNLVSNHDKELAQECVDILMSKEHRRYVLNELVNFKSLLN